MNDSRPPETGEGIAANFRHTLPPPNSFTFKAVRSLQYNNNNKYHRRVFVYCEFFVKTKKKKTSADFVFPHQTDAIPGPAICYVFRMDFYRYRLHILNGFCAPRRI